MSDTPIFKNDIFEVRVYDKQAGDFLEGEMYVDENGKVIQWPLTWYSEDVIGTQRGVEDKVLPAYQPSKIWEAGYLKITTPKPCKHVCISPVGAPNWTHIIDGQVIRLKKGEEYELKVPEGEHAYVDDGDALVLYDGPSDVLVEPVEDGVVALIRPVPHAPGHRKQYTPKRRRELRRKG